MDRSRPRLEKSTVVPALYELLMIAGLAIAAGGAMVASFGIAKAFMDVVHGARSAHCNWPEFAAAAAVVTLVGGGVALSALRCMPNATRDCDRYGRHMIGLTYVLVVLGLCNAIGTSVLALDGWLTVSVASLMESANPKRAREADEHKAQLEKQLHELEKTKRSSERKLGQLQEDERSCLPTTAAPPAAAGAVVANSDPCSGQKLRVRDQRALVTEQADGIADLNTELKRAEEHCKKAREDSRLALFFLLSLSTMMALLGACFYVVNAVRLKRTVPDEDPALPSPSGPPAANGERLPKESASVVNEVKTEQEVVSTRVEVEVPAHAGALPQSPKVTTNTLVTKPTEKGESFDEHAFWSGAFFRVGEAVLFTFAFFWLMWTSDESGNIAWLPVLALFIGMFVKTGETIVFRLGTRALSAAEAMLPGPGSSSTSTSTQGGASPNNAANEGAPPPPNDEAPPQKGGKPPNT